MVAEDVMTRGIMSIKKGATVAEAMKKMMDRRVTSLLVKIKNIENRESKSCKDFGIVTRRDICYAIIEKHPLDIKVEDIVSFPLVTVPRDLAVREILELMKRKNIRRVPVVDRKNNIIGLVSNSDILRAVTIEILEEEMLPKEE